MMRWSSLHRSTQVAVVVGAALSLILLGPIAAAVVMLRCCGGAQGPGAGARIMVGLVVLAVTIFVGTAAGGIASLVRRLIVRRQSDPC